MACPVMTGLDILPRDGGTVELALSCLWLLLVAWLIARAAGQRTLLTPVGPAVPLPPNRAPPLAVIVPARNEEANIAACLRGLLAQDYPASAFSVLVVDDHSSDATTAIARSMARSHGVVTVLTTPPLPPRWIGKSHACWIGANAASSAAEWLCFVDADVRFATDLLSRAMSAVNAESLDLLSLAPRQELGSFAERLVMPCGLYLLGFCQDLRDVQSRQGRDVTATGQFMLIRRSAYDAVGGHAAIRSDICEDTALARLIKRNGGYVLMHDGAGLLSTRMYTGWQTLWPGVAKNLVDMLGGTRSTVTIALAAVVLSWAAWLVPVADAASCIAGTPHACLALAPAAAASAATFGLHIAGTWFFRIPFWYGFLFPLGYTAGAAMAFDSIRRRWRGQITWKGRTYP